MDTPEQIQVEVAYALPRRSWVIPVTVPAGSTVRDAIKASGILQQCPDINLDNNKVGIFGRLQNPDSALRDGDRVEIYRNLKADPKEARRKRASGA